MIYEMVGKLSKAIQFNSVLENFQGHEWELDPANAASFHIVIVQKEAI